MNEKQQIYYASFYLSDNKPVLALDESDVQFDEDTGDILYNVGLFSSTSKNFQYSYSSNNHEGIELIKQFWLTEKAIQKGVWFNERQIEDNHELNLQNENSEQNEKEGEKQKETKKKNVKTKQKDKQKEKIVKGQSKSEIQKESKKILQSQSHKMDMDIPKEKKKKVDKIETQIKQTEQTERKNMPHIIIGDYEVFVVVDDREKRQNDIIEAFCEELLFRGVPTIRRRLVIGDIIWIAKRIKKPKHNKKKKIKKKKKNLMQKDKININNSDNEIQSDEDSTEVDNQDITDSEEEDDENDEFILDCIVERKTIDDLKMSLKDTRFDEQRFRLARCGINRVVYLIEGELGSSSLANVLNTVASTASLAAVTSAKTNEQKITERNKLKEKLQEKEKIQQKRNFHGWSGKNAGHWHKQEDTMKSNVSFLTAMQTAMRNIQIHSGFIVHQCAHRDDTADYIAMLTQQMVQYYTSFNTQINSSIRSQTPSLHKTNSQSLLLVKSHSLSSSLDIQSISQFQNQSQPINQSSLLQSSQLLNNSPLFSITSQQSLKKAHQLQIPRLISFKDLQLQNTKGPKTIGELWLHMLAQLPGISSVAAECIASIYPTPFILFQALQKIRSEDERINLFKSIRIGSKVMSLKVAKSLADFFE